MEKLYKNYLMSKRILVSNVAEPSDTRENISRALFCLYNQYGVIVSKGKELVTASVVKDYMDEFNEQYNETAFYRNYPMSVLKLTPGQKRLDQLVHYTITYGFGEFDEAGHSIFEQELTKRKPLNEYVTPTVWNILTEEEATKEIETIVKNLLLGTRPLNKNQEELVINVYHDETFDNKAIFKTIKSKNVAMRLLLLTNDLYFTKFISLSDVPKFVEELLATSYVNKDYEVKVNIKKLNLTNKDRKLITKIIDVLLDKKYDIRECCEKKKVWCGLLHHIHYKAKNDNAKLFLNTIRGDKNISVYSETENLMKSHNAVGAAKVLKDNKGSSAVLRNLNYLLTRCQNEADVFQVIDNIGEDFNLVVGVQLLQNYKLNKGVAEPRVFTFTKYKLQNRHKETVEEVQSRRSVVSKMVSEIAATAIKTLIDKKLHDKIVKKVYIDPEMKNIALPINESTGNTGLGYMISGSRVPLEDNNVRVFTYWEKVNDIDLATFIIGEDGKQQEFSWRTNYRNTSTSIVFSGDQTSGFNGGSEYFDIDMSLFKQEHPEARYIIFTDNVFSGKTFSECYCKAGFMLRKELTEGNIFEPKTVKTSYMITGESTFSYLFAIDLKTNEIVWLNTAINSNSRVAGNENVMENIQKKLHATEIFNVYDFFEQSSAMLVSDPETAELIVSDNYQGDNVVHSYDVDKILAYMNM